MSSPKKPKEVMSLAGRVAVLSKFMSRAIDHCTPFFDVLKRSKKIAWTMKCKQAFQALKEHLGHPPLLSKPIEGEKFYLYVAISKEVVSGVLIRKEGKVQWPVYYVSKRLLDLETRYPELEKLALALVVASRKLRPYFHVHLIEVLTNYPLRHVLQKPEASSRLLKWAIELGQFDVYFFPRMAIKGQVLADFMAEFTYANTTEIAGTVDGTEAVKVVKVGDKENSTPTQEDTQ